MHNARMLFCQQDYKGNGLVPSIEKFFAFASRHGQFIKDFLDNRFAGFFLGLGFVGGFLILRRKVVTQSSHGCHRIEIV